jgi:hypothetical protein
VPVPRLAPIAFAVVAIAATAASGCGPATEARRSAAPASSADALQKSIVKANLGREGDPDLGARYQEINRRHFEALLPAIPVRWEPRLSEVDAQSADGLKLLGTFGKLGERAVILLNPSLQTDEDDLARALAHEMVHAYLATTLGDEDVKHGLSYQAVLRRLASEGAFKGIPSTEIERQQLRTWLDQAKPGLDSEAAVSAFNREVERYNLMLLYPNGEDKER